MRIAIVQSVALRVALISLLSGLVVYAAPALTVAVSGPDAVTDVKNLQFQVTITNTGQETLKLINEPHGPLTTSPTDVFLITGPNKVAPTFAGISVKYAGVKYIAVNGSSNAFTTLAAGKSIVVTHNLSKAYNFKVSGPGKYIVKTVDLFHYVDDSKRATPIKATTQSHQFTLRGKLTATRSEADLQERATFVGCTAEQQLQIDISAKIAQIHVSESITYVKYHKSATPRLTTWFGAFQDTRREAILSNFNSLTTHGDEFSGWKYDCTLEGCDAGVFAFVDPYRYGEVHLCDSFWAAPVTGTDSKAGTLVHEGTHFVATADTTDIAYGHAACEKLAKTDPNQAIMNADSYEYFVENTPYLK